MEDQENMQTRQVYARIAGFMYLFVTVTYIFGMLTASKFTVPDNFAETSKNILANEGLYRTAIASQLISSLSVVLLALAFFALLKSVDKNLAMLALIFRVGEAAIGGVMALISYTTLYVYSGPGSLEVFEPDKLQGLAAILSAAGSAGFYIAAIFFGFGSTVFFYLLIKSRYIPKILAVWGLFASVVVLVIGFANLIVPDQAGVLERGWLTMFIAEISTGLWLLVFGIKSPLQNSKMASQ